MTESVSKDAALLAAAKVLYDRDVQTSGNAFLWEPFEDGSKAAQARYIEAAREVVAAYQGVLDNPETERTAISLLPKKQDPAPGTLEYAQEQAYKNGEL